jgi:hypothetical protein
VKGEDAVVVTGQFASQKHSYSLPDGGHRSPWPTGRPKPVDLWMLGRQSCPGGHTCG